MRRFLACAHMLHRNPQTREDTLKTLAVRDELKIDSLRALAELWPSRRGDSVLFQGFLFGDVNRLNRKSSPPSVLSSTSKFSPSWCSSCLAVLFCLHSSSSFFFSEQGGWGWKSSESIQMNRLCLLPSSQLSSVATVPLEFRPHCLYRRKISLIKWLQWMFLWGRC